MRQGARAGENHGPRQRAIVIPLGFFSKPRPGDYISSFVGKDCFDPLGADGALPVTGPLVSCFFQDLFPAFPPESESESESWSLDSIRLVLTNLVRWAPILVL